MTEQAAILIAIADDHAVVRDSISNMVSGEGKFKVIIKAGNGRELIEQLAKANPLPEICILDIQMPEMNGYETMEYIRQHWPDLKVLALSMLEDEFAIIRMLKLGACGYLSKASDLEELQKALIYIHKRGYYSSEFIASNYLRSIKPNNPAAINITDRYLSPEDAAIAKQVYDKSWYVEPAYKNAYGSPRGNKDVLDGYSTFSITFMYRLETNKIPWWY